QTAGGAVPAGGAAAAAASRPATGRIRGSGARAGDDRVERPGGDVPARADSAYRRVDCVPVRGARDDYRRTDRASAASARLLSGGARRRASTRPLVRHAAAETVCTVGGRHQVRGAVAGLSDRERTGGGVDGRAG